MRNYLLALTLLTVAGHASGAFAQDTSWSSETARLGLLTRATALTGKTVGDRKDRTLGKLEDMIVDLRHGRVLFTLVSAGKAEQLTLVPSQNYAYLSKPKLVLNVDRKVFQKAPHVPRTNALSAINLGAMGAACTHFNVKMPEDFPKEARELSSSSGLAGAALVSSAHELLGHVKDVMVDLPLGRAVYLVVEPVPGPGQENVLYAVPPVSVRSDASGTTLVLDGEQAHFLAGPHFSPEFWTDMAFPQLAAAVRKHYHLASDPLGTPPATEPSLALRSGDSGTPLRAAATRSDQEITRAILAEIVHEASGFLNVSISVNTVDGRVRLTGKVRSEKQKKQIILAAERVAGPGNVDEQLETGSKSKTAQL